MDYTHGQSKPGNIKTFSTFVVWCHFWRQCLGEMHFFTFTPYPSLMGHLDITTLWRTERRSHGESHIRKMRQMHCQTLPSSILFVFLSSERILQRKMVPGLPGPTTAEGWLWYRKSRSLTCSLSWQVHSNILGICSALSCSTCVSTYVLLKLAGFNSL